MIVVEAHVLLWLDAGLAELALDGGTAMRSAQLAGFHGDPADRFIVGSALERGAALMTADREILAWRGGPSTLDARL